ncbi:MAG: Rps23 Pro-64 3,4-dihydroxylase Tpa1-like proline 4-hydroxylase, partial [Kiritimatiellia bacterium]
TKLHQLAAESRHTYQNASPYAHGCFDDVFEPSILKKILEEFDIKDKENWKEFDTKYEKKLQLSADEDLGPYTRALINNLNSGTFLKFLEELTGITKLIADPYLSGGGLHKIEPGGKLGIHVDFNRNDHLQVHRRINVLVYLNEDWEESYGGHFELWGDELGANKVKILPIFNRMAIFNTTGTSFHGHPEPLTCPPERSRKSLALYYYTVAKDNSQSKRRHGTVFINDKGQTEEIGRVGLFKKMKNTLRTMIKGLSKD